MKLLRQSKTQIGAGSVRKSHEILKEAIEPIGAKGGRVKTENIYSLSLQMVRG